MALNVSAWSIRQPLPAIVFSLIMLALGWMSFLKLPITRLPNADIPVISVVVAEFGAAPAELEAQVTKPIEDAVSGVEGVHTINSTITDGISATTIMFTLESNTDRALNDVKDAVTRVRNTLPQNINEPLVQRVDVVGLPILTYAAISPGKTQEQLSWYVDNVVIRALQGVHGVAQVERVGGVEREILVSLDPQRLEAVGLTALDVSHRLRGTIVNLAGGRAGIGGRDEAIRTLAGSNTVAGLAATMIGLPSGGEVRLDDLGIVTDTVAERSTFARATGEPVVAVAITRAKGASDVVVAKQVQARIDQLTSADPTVDLNLIDSSVEFTRGHYVDAIETLFAGAGLAVLIVFLFLRDWRLTVIAAISLPLSIFPAFWAMDLLGFSLNLVSLLAITLSTGVLVDDAIVEVENIVRHIRMGKSPYQAAIEAADEIGLAVIAISLTIVAIFAPASFMSGIAGQFFKQFGITVSVQVIFSLLAARFITPMLAAYFLRPQMHAERPPGRLLRSYTALVSWSVRHYFFTICIGLILFAASIWSMELLPKGFLPAQDAARSLLAIELPPGSQLSDTERKTEDIVAMLRKRPEVKSVFVDGGRVAHTLEVRKASLIINYVPKSKRSRSQHELELVIGRDLGNVPDIHYWFLDENGLRAVSLFVSGTDSRTVDNVASELARQMQRIALISNVTAATSLERPELRIRPQSDLATRLGVSTENLAETIRVATIGDFGPALAKFDAGDQQVPIRVQLEDTARTDRQVLEQLRVPLPMGRGSVPLTAIADIRLDQGPTSISRYNRERQATVSADLAGTAALGDALKKIYELPVMKGLPKGITVSESGDAESLNELANGFKTAMIGGLMMVYAVLVLLFGSFLQPITILFSLPLSIGGAIAALLLTGQQLTTPVWIGVLMLMGIVTKNAIMLVDFAMESMHAGIERDLAIIDAGQKRARPIIMTTIAMIAGMTPAALAYGAGGEFRAPMALAVIGGLIVSTMLSLVFVPAFMTMMDDVGRIIWRFGRRILTPAQETPGVSDAERTQAH
ncbi:MAG TPA: efflux RND transporter permease subunit [Xanthobacteraceae bacterium]|jgi:multidrug efflux pump subunit AcrB|nr:efflux RND transporter permease subunit [Xanthobacteraceae bacterium]